MTCWIGVAASRHVAAGVGGGFAMFGHGDHRAALRVAAGDWVTYYSPREELSGGAAIRAFTAIGVALPGEAAEHEMQPGMTGWRRPMRWLDARPAGIYPLLDQLSFVTDRRHWGMYFRRSLFHIEQADFAVIAETMGVGAEFAATPA